MNKYILSALLMGAFVFGACNKDENKPIEPPIVNNGNKEVKDLDASKSDVWVYFSFSKGSEVPVTEPATDLSWDIAFNRYNIKTNGGTSGKGQAGVVNTNTKKFDSVKESPTEGYVVDTEVVSSPRPGQEPVTISVNSAITGTVMVKEAKGWWNYAPPVPPATTPTQEITKWVYVVKTADGKFVKIQLTGYNHSKTDKSGFLTFTYKYSTDGKF
ncbi:HmuY family protein [Capnocytophaga cynodegmi]|uniref:HmuY family protein n=1 Tax=Capnocytophaga cynodegmi TaxID=28189 RepID=UPI0038598E54